MNITKDTMTALKAMLSKERDEAVEDDDSWKNGHEAATNRLIGIIQQAVGMAEFYGNLNHWGKSHEDYGSIEVFLPHDDGKKAREFLETLKELK